MSYRDVEVLYNTGDSITTVGRLAVLGADTIFEYDTGWIGKGIQLAPIMMPTTKQQYALSEFDRSVFGTFGLFADSLPDGWGMRLMDRWFEKHNISRNQITIIDRLAYLGDCSMGALCFRPPTRQDNSDSLSAINIGELANEAFDLFSGKIEDAGRLLMNIGGSPGGARPKGLIGISEDGRHFISGAGRLPDDYSHWLVKFSGNDNKHEGCLEFTYNQMAKEAGISVPEHRLIDDGAGLSHFAVRRFDRMPGNKRIHVATVGGLLHANHTQPSLDYSELTKLAWRITQNVAQVEEQFRRAAFNMFAVNRDDHAKNHGYSMSGNGEWILSPAYDITYSEGPNGYHWTGFSGEALNPKVSDLMKIADLASISEKSARLIIERVKEAVSSFKRVANENGVPSKIATPIIKRVNSILH